MIVSALVLALSLGAIAVAVARVNRADRHNAQCWRRGKRRRWRDSERS